MTFIKSILTALIALSLFTATAAQMGAQTNPYGNAPTAIQLCNKCEGHRFCSSCEGTGRYAQDPCAICSGSGICYYCEGTGRF